MATDYPLHPDSLRQANSQSGTPQSHTSQTAGTYAPPARAIGVGRIALDHPLGQPYTHAVPVRDEFPEDVKRIVAARAGNRCSNPDCHALTSGPQIDPTKALNVGVAAHITAAAPGGPRYDPNLTPEERRHPDNAIWLCQNCAKLVDNDPARFTVDLLRKWKAEAEKAASEQIGKTAVPVSRTGAERLPLRIDRPQPLTRTPLSRLLRPYNAFIGLMGREPELESLASFCDRLGAFRWKVLTGAGGVGKTRLALEVAMQREQADWNSGFLRAESLKHWVGHNRFADWHPPTDTLVVIDYAASKLEDLKHLLERCGQWAQGHPEPARLRLLLLERQADPDDGWLHDLLSFGEGALRDQVRDSMEPVQEITAPGREAPDEVMEAILRATLEGWARRPAAAASEARWAGTARASTADRGPALVSANGSPAGVRRKRHLETHPVGTGGVA